MEAGDISQCLDQLTPLCVKMLSAMIEAGTFVVHTVWFLDRQKHPSWGRVKLLSGGIQVFQYNFFQSRAASIKYKIERYNTW